MVRTRDGQAASGGRGSRPLAHRTSPEAARSRSLRTDRARSLHVRRAGQAPPQVFRVVYEGSATTLPSQREVTPGRPCAARRSALARACRERSGRDVRRPRPLAARPAGGKLVELQVVLSGRWQTFRTVRTDPQRRLASPLPLPAKLRRAALPLPGASARGSRAIRSSPGHTHAVGVRSCGSAVPMTEATPIDARTVRSRNGGHVIDRLRRNLSYANVMATLAVFIALGGSSYAALQLTGRDIRDGSLTGRDLQRNSLGGKSIKESRLGVVPRARERRSPRWSDGGSAPGALPGRHRAGLRCLRRAGARELRLRTASPP